MKHSLAAPVPLTDAFPPVTTNIRLGLGSEGWRQHVCFVVCGFSKHALSVQSLIKRVSICNDREQEISGKREQIIGQTI